MSKPIPAPLQCIQKAQTWCEAYGFKKDHPSYPDLIHAFIAGYGTAERDIAEWEGGKPE